MAPTKDEDKCAQDDGGEFLCYTSEMKPTNTIIYVLRNASPPYYNRTSMFLLNIIDLQGVTSFFA